MVPLNVMTLFEFVNFILLTGGSVCNADWKIIVWTPKHTLVIFWPSFAKIWSQPGTGLKKTIRILFLQDQMVFQKQSKFKSSRIACIKFGQTITLDPPGTYLHNVNYGNTRTMCEIYNNDTITTSFIYFVLLFLLMTLEK